MKMDIYICIKLCGNTRKTGMLCAIPSSITEPENTRLILTSSIFSVCIKLCGNTRNSGMFYATHGSNKESGNTRLIVIPSAISGCIMLFGNRMNDIFVSFLVVLWNLETVDW